MNFFLKLEHSETIPNLDLLQTGFPTSKLGQREGMSDCDKLKLRKMYKCDIGEYANKCLDYNSSICKEYESKGLCELPFTQQHCKKTCNSCDVCMDNYGINTCKNLSYDGRCCEKEVMKNCMKTCNLCGII